MAAIELKLTIDTNDLRYSLWCTKASIRECLGLPSPMHEVMHKAGLWKRA